MQYLSLIYKIEDLEVFKISAATGREPERPLIGKKAFSNATCVHLDQIYLVLTTFDFLIEIFLLADTRSYLQRWEIGRWQTQKVARSL